MCGQGLEGAESVFPNLSVEPLLQAWAKGLNVEKQSVQRHVSEASSSVVGWPGPDWLPEGRAGSGQDFFFTRFIPLADVGMAL